MAENINATKINFIQTKKTLNLAESGRDVLERKRDILLRELRNNIFDAEHTRSELLEVLNKAYQSLHKANMAKGSQTIANAILGSTNEAEYLVDYRSIMGVPVPLVSFNEKTVAVRPDYGFADTNADLDDAFKQFYVVLQLLSDLAKAEGTIFQLANDVRRTQRRVNALNYVLIPRYRNLAKWIEMVLEEKDREEFIRTKHIKNVIQKHQKELSKSENV
ncbi:V-type ATP synthase subunit D [Candidatus Bathycorpusculum sp.]|jgi:V/A-type H+-transporting ATPase subunit D|uniref:V-type ATP synthase subunit D n=1 Tax=Candidatus Bathycorpusculum sp. TaxID=2994959 RepID=UPI0028287793|nr:V-type ATP synthase subunit D [Candidatus Termitimicrobium sp.]MCL2685254.1 V-type ATP synthase subunit D [Candidatus Termitimicrobium sp.]